MCARVHLLRKNNQSGSVFARTLELPTLPQQNTASHAPGSRSPRVPAPQATPTPFPRRGLQTAPGNSHALSRVPKLPRIPFPRRPFAGSGIPCPGPPKVRRPAQVPEVRTRIAGVCGFPRGCGERRSARGQSVHGASGLVGRWSAEGVGLGGGSVSGCACARGGGVPLLIPPCTRETPGVCRV